MAIKRQAICFAFCSAKQISRAGFLLCLDPKTLFSQNPAFAEG